MTLEILEAAFENWNNKILLEINKNDLNPEILKNSFHGFKLNTIETNDNKVKIQMSYQDEYNMVSQTFKNIQFFNFSSEYFVKTHDQRPKIAISINGNIIQQPNREYYVVFDTPTTYMIQVYNIDSNLKREGSMLFGVFMNEDNCELYHPETSI